MPPSALSAKTCVVCHFGRLLWEGNSAALFVQQSCQQTSSCSRHRDLGTHTRRASHNCHALRYHSGAHGGGVPMPPSALSAENCVVCHFGRLLWKFRGALTAVADRHRAAVAAEISAHTHAVPHTTATP